MNESCSYGSTTSSAYAYCGKQPTATVAAYAWYSTDMTWYTVISTRSIIDGYLTPGTLFRNDCCKVSEHSIWFK